MKKKETILTFLFLIFFYKIIDTGIKWVSEPFSQRSGLWQDWTAENSGESLVLPTEVSEMKDLVASHRLEDFYLSQEVTNNSILYQRAIESLFPRLCTKKSLNHFFLNSETLPVNCDKINEKQTVTLARCR